MLNLLNMVVGLFLLIYDGIKNIILVIIDFFKLIITNNRKNNYFLKLILKSNWLITYILFGVFFFFFSQWNALGALIGSIPVFILWIHFKNNNNNNYGLDGDLLGYMFLFVSISFLMITETKNNAYDYEKIGSYDFKKNELVYSMPRQKKIVIEHYNHIDMVINGKEISVDVRGCTPGEHNILKETLPIRDIPFINIGFPSYYADCSVKKSNYKKIGVKDEK